MSAMTGTPIAAIIGLGNPGPEHLLDRHNAGFWFVDRLAARDGVSFRANSRYHGDVARLRFGSDDIVVLKPQTYMNRSGQSVRALLDYLKFEPARVLVVHDELDLSAGVARFKFGGGAGGHNGLKDVIRHIGPDFWRLRLGVGHPGDKSRVIGHVLERATREEEDAIHDAISAALDALSVFVEAGAEKAMNRLHSKDADAD